MDGSIYRTTPIKDSYKFDKVLGEYSLQFMLEDPSLSFVELSVNLITRRSR